MHRHNSISRRTTLAVLIGLVIGLVAGCEIEETPPLAVGSVSVSLVDTDGNAIPGALIRIDGRDTPRFTPALLNNISVGSHIVGAFKPGYIDTALSVEIRLNETTVAELVTDSAEGGSIDLVNAPDGTVLLLNNIPVGTVPASWSQPTLFERLGMGIYRATAYLPGYATELPAEWSVQLSAAAAVSLLPLFASVETGAETGNLAPAFELPCDWDSSFYRLQDYRGQVVLISFFFVNCSACMEELPYIAEIYEAPEFSGKVQFFGIDFVDSYPVFARFRNEHPTFNITFPLLRDGRQQVRQAYAVSTCPKNFIIDATGRVRTVTGSISEPQLRQTLSQLLAQAGGPTFRFSMHDTLITYNNGNQSFNFLGRLDNLLEAQRTFMISLNPIQFPDTGRFISICTYNGCAAPISGTYILQENYAPLQSDTLLSFDIYNQVSDWSLGFPMPVDSPITGDYVMQAMIYPADNTSERVVYNLHLDDTRASASAWFSADRNPTGIVGGTLNNNSGVRR